jgi:hypothetical protein
LSKCPRCGGQMIVEYGDSSCLCCGYLPGGSLIPGQSIGPAPERDGTLVDKDSGGSPLKASLKALLTHPKEEEKMVTATMVPNDALAPVPLKPARHGKGGGNIAIGHYYTAHLAELKDEAKQYGDAATRERWGLSNSQFSRLKERWTCAPPRDKVSKSVPAEGTPQSVVRQEEKPGPTMADVMEVYGQSPRIGMSVAMQTDLVFGLICGFTSPRLAAEKIVALFGVLG